MQVASAIILGYHASVAASLRPGAYLVALGGSDLSIRLRCDGLYLVNSFAIFFPGPRFRSAFLFRKPGELAELEGLTERGMLNVDACRTPGLAKVPWGKIRAYRIFSGPNRWDSAATMDAPAANPLGRWPANVGFIHTPGCRRDSSKWACVEGCPVLHLPTDGPDDVAELYPQFADEAACFDWLRKLITPPGGACDLQLGGVSKAP